MLRRGLVRSFLLVLAVLGMAGGAVLYAQLESGDRGILPLDSSNTLEIGGIKVDTTGKTADEARYAGWRIAQREGFKALWAKAHGAPLSAAPNLPDSTLDGLVSSIIVESEQIGPTRYIATLGVLFDRARASELLGMAGPVRRSAPLLLVPITVTGGNATSVELRNAWQRAWAEFRTSNSPIDYVRVSGMGMDPLLVNAAQADRPGRGWWRNIVDQYGAADILVAEVQLRRVYPGGPATGTFSGYFGADRKPLGSFTLTAQNSAGLQDMMNRGVAQMDALFARWQAAGELAPDRSLLPPPLPPPPVEEEAPVAKPVEQTTRVIQIFVTSPYSPVAWLRSIPGVTNVQEFGAKVLAVTYKGTQGQLAAALNARGWQTDTASDGVFRITGYKGQLVKPQPAPAAPAQPGNTVQPAPNRPGED
ncbi:heavy-metal-associated domain-containing protein [Sphingomonas sp. KRR8]|uniref:heavy-metal-associated domain-containing protein n=1 Tax=Sphingomonas sp. KRR8 TaxID=2942996 RepID=UPI002021D8FC|nr:heavy-metal-associated domain-containing protein [Sphingomonas sp. KRR8]URD62129.1 heavy-metal-associated domain-containing protein [Sphingomonas sp. KRR8]